MMSNQDEVKAGHKRTEVGVIPEDWEVFSLDRLTSKISDGIHATPMYSNTGSYSFVNGNNVVDGQIKIDVKTKRITHAEYLKYRVSIGSRTIFLSINGTIGNIGLYNNEKIVLGKSIAYLNIRPNILVEYIYYALQSERVKQYFADNLTGSTIKNLGIGVIKGTQIALPNYQEQTAIAKALSDTDTRITTLNALIHKKEQIKQGAMQQLLTGKIRLKGFGKGVGVKQTELGEIPEDWMVDSLKEVADIKRGASPRPIDSPKWFDNSSETGWLRISDVTKSDKYLRNTVQNLSEEGIKHSRPVSKGALVMSICATVGRPIIVQKEICIHDGFVVFKNLRLDRDFAYYILQELEKSWGEKGQTGSQMNLNTELINTTIIAFPSDKPEQTAIANTLTAIDTDIQTLKQRLAKTKALKQGMMQELLTGKTRLVPAAFSEELTCE